jgi:hypothetical protein
MTQTPLPVTDDWSEADAARKRPAYVPPPRLLELSITRGTGANGKPTVTMPLEAFTRLLEAAMSGAFDEADYLRRHMDVQVGVAAGEIPSAIRHYAAHGYFEGRATLSYEVDADWYLTMYPDVQEAISAGQVRDAAHHFEAFGWAEGRVPNPDYAASAGEWHQIAAAALKSA